MTEMQLKYLAHQEQVRHNAATEAMERTKQDETARSNLAKEALSGGELDEKVRHNKVAEGQNRQSLHETQRHNKKSEEIDTLDAILKGFGAIAKLAP